MSSNNGAAGKLAAWFPHARSPIIISAPMLGVANGTLAAEVSKAGGIGIIPGGFDFTPGNSTPADLDAQLAAARRVLGLPPAPAPANAEADGTGSMDDDDDDKKKLAPPLSTVGVGFILLHESVVHLEEAVLPVLRRHRPRLVWLFAWDIVLSAGMVRKAVARLRAEGFLVAVQLGNVATAREVVGDGVDLLVAQGSDAGGHQMKNNSGVVALVPEVRAMLRAGREGGAGEEEQEGGEGKRKFADVALAAAGGIVDGAGLAAALALGAEAAVMGTRFITCPESTAAPWFKNAILEAKDGGVSTVKSTFHDDLRGPPPWPHMYDARAVIGDSWRDHQAGMPLEENMALLQEARKTGDAARLIAWAGTGVGLVNDLKPAGDIVREVREEARKIIRGLQAFV